MLGCLLQPPPHCLALQLVMHPAAAWQGLVFSPHSPGMRELLSAPYPANLISAELRGRLLSLGEGKIEANTYRG